MADCSARIEVGDVLDGRYVLRERIGQGGMGCVFRAEQIALERAVVIKILRPELAGCHELLERLRNEALAACRVRNPHCVAMIDCVILPDGAPFLVMEHVTGRPLGRVIAEQSIPLTRAVDVFEQILSAIGATHDAGVVHADVASDNFLVESVDGRDHVTMIDFGLARIMGGPAWNQLVNGEETISGTPEYMAPEVIHGEPPTRASDLYGAGVILYELLTGTVPFRGKDPMTIMLGHARAPVVPPSLHRSDRGLPPAIDDVVLRALDKRPEARFPDAATFAHELRSAAGTPRSPGGSTHRDAAPASSVASRRRDSTPPGRLARGSDRGTERLQRLRGAIGKALVRGDSAQIADGYLELAAALDVDQPVLAARELEEGIDILTAGRGPAAAGAPLVVERLVVALAALHERAGSRLLARRIVTSMDRCDTLTDAAR